MSVFQLHGAGIDTAAVQRNSSTRAQAQSPGTAPRNSASGSASSVEVHEHERSPGVDPHRDRARARRIRRRAHRIPAATAPRGAGRSRSYDHRWNGQRISVRPAPGALAQRAPTVPARVLERAQLAVVAPHEEDRERPDPELVEVARVRYVVERARELPHARPEPLVLQGRERARRVARAGMVTATATAPRLRALRPASSRRRTAPGKPARRAPAERIARPRAERSRTPRAVSGSTGVHNVRTLRPVKRPWGRQNAAALVRPRDGFGARCHCVWRWAAAGGSELGGGGLGGATTTDDRRPTTRARPRTLTSPEVGVTPTTITVTVIADVEQRDSGPACSRARGTA